MVKPLVYSAYRLFLRAKRRRIEKSSCLGPAAALTPTFFAERRSESNHVIFTTVSSSGFVHRCSALHQLSHATRKVAEKPQRRTRR